MLVEDLKITIESGKDGNLRARLNGTYRGEKHFRFSAPFSLVEAERETDRLDRLHYKALESQEAVREAKEAKASSEEVRRLQDLFRAAQADLSITQHRVGSRLMSALTQGELGHCLGQYLGRVEEDPKEEYLRIQMCFDLDDEDTAYLTALPWELIYRLDCDEFVSTSESVAVTRCLDTGQPYRPLLVDGPLRVLMVVAAPKNLRRIDPEDEKRAIQRLIGSVKSTEVEVVVREQLSLKQLHDLLCDYPEPIHILHFVGHGGFDPETQQGTLAFVDADELDERVTGQRLIEALKVSGSLRLVVLSTCKGAALPRRQATFPFIGVAHAALKAGVPAVVAMQAYISDRAAEAFSDGFYSALAKLEPIEMAVARGRRVLYLQEALAAEWAVPTLFLQVGSGQGTLFTHNPENAVVGASDPAAQRFRIGIRSGVFANDMDFAVALKERTEPFFLDLSEHFDGQRVIRRPGAWQTRVFPELRQFLYNTMAKIGNRAVELEMATHASLAFAIGYVMEAKSGFDFVLRQSTRTGKALYFSQEDPQPLGVLWNRDTERPIQPAARDVALAISVSWPILTDVEEYVEASGLQVGRIVPVSIAPEPGQRSIRGGAHAMELAQQLSNIIRQRSREERKGTLHVFVSAPNAFLFFLGQLARGFGSVQLYEHNHSTGVLGNYRPSLYLPPVENRTDETENPPKRPFRGYEPVATAQPSADEGSKTQGEGEQADETPADPKPDSIRDYDK